MKKISFSIFILVAVFGLALAAPLTVEQNDVQEFIKKLYHIDSKMFEFGYFEGKFDPKKQAVLHANFFAKELLNTVKDVTGVDGAGWVRHPSSDEYQLSGESGPVPTKNPKMRPPVVNGDQSYVDVYPDNGRTIYFLEKASNGWRIVNTASYNLWPRNDGTCWQPFYLVKPTPDQLSLETKECIRFRKAESGNK